MNDIEKDYEKLCKLADIERDKNLKRVNQEKTAFFNVVDFILKLLK